jgi:CBS domain-containing protein
MSKAPPCRFTWLLLGSQARAEQLLMTDQDHALVFENVKKENYEKAKAYFLELGQKLSKTLEEVGFELCPAEMMASNPEYCCSLSEWEHKFRTWIKSPTEKSVLFCNIFFDFKRAFGDKTLETELRKSVLELLRSDDKFFAYLASDALKNPPPVSFFGKFIVEDDGAHKDEFDLKARAIMPLVDAARVLILSQQVIDKNETVMRYRKMAEIEPQNADLYESCIRSFYELLKYRSQSGFAHNDSGRFVNLETLSKHDKNKLKYLFKPIKTLQTNLRTRFNLTYFT